MSTRCMGLGCDHYMCADHRYVVGEVGEQLDHRCIHCTGAPAATSASSSATVVDEREGKISVATPETHCPDASSSTTFVDVEERTPETHCSGGNDVVGDTLENVITSATGHDRRQFIHE